MSYIEFSAKIVKNAALRKLINLEKLCETKRNNAKTNLIQKHLARSIFLNKYTFGLFKIKNMSDEEAHFFLLNEFDDFIGIPLGHYPYEPEKYFSKSYNRAMKLSAICACAEREGTRNILLSINDAHLIGLDLLK